MQPTTRRNDDVEINNDPEVITESQDNEPEEVNYDQQFLSGLFDLYAIQKNETQSLKQQIEADELAFLKDEELWNMEKKYLQQRIQFLLAENKYFKLQLQSPGNVSSSVIEEDESNSIEINDQPHVPQQLSKQIINPSIPLAQKLVNDQPIRSVTQPNRSNKRSRSQVERIPVPHLSSDEDDEPATPNIVESKPQAKRQKTESYTPADEKMKYSIFHKFKTKKDESPSVTNKDDRSVRRNTSNIPSVSTIRSDQSNISHLPSYIVNTPRRRPDDEKRKQLAKSSSQSKITEHMPKVEAFPKTRRSRGSKEPVQIDLTTPKKNKIEMGKISPNENAGLHLKQLRFHNQKSAKQSDTIKEPKASGSIINERNRETSERERYSDQYQLEHNIAIEQAEQDEDYYRYMASEESQIEHIKKKNPRYREENYVRQEVVRKKAERQLLPGHECEECKKFYDMLQEERYLTHDQRRRLVNSCSRHRSKTARPSTPDNFWNYGGKETFLEVTQQEVQETQLSPTQPNRTENGSLTF